MNIFMCGITSDTDECNTDFAMMVMTLPFEIEGHNLHVCFERSFEKAFAFAQSASVQYDRVIVIRATKSNKAFVQRAIKHGENRLIYGVYGIPRFTGTAWHKDARHAITISPMLSSTNRVRMMGTCRSLRKTSQQSVHTASTHMMSSLWTGAC